MIFTTAVIADIHFGAIKPEILYQELREEFLAFLKDKYIDMVVIAGDFYNSIISLNSQSALKSFMFMQELVTQCEMNGVKYIRIIEGTLSHDNFQILNFRMHERNTKLSFKIITKVEKEVLPEGIKILYLPEEYMENPITYYEPFVYVKPKYYDFIFGHGMFRETAFTKDDGESQISKAPIWDSKLLGTITRGPIFFGHIHTSQVIRKHIYYTGSFSRWVYGQEEDKGFYLCAYDTATGKYAVEFKKNKLARPYDTVTLNMSQYSGDLDSLVATFKKLKQDHLRIQILIDAQEKDFSYELSFLKEYFTGKPGYKLDLVDKREKVQQEQIEAKVNKLLEDYNFLFDKTLPVSTKIHKFIKRKYKREVSEEKIKALLNLDTVKSSS